MSVGESEVVVCQAGETETVSGGKSEAVSAGESETVVCVSW